MNIVVTGGAGFVGVNLCLRLLEEGHKVICVDNFISSKRSNIDQLRRFKKFSLVKHDITKPLLLPGKIDRIYNLASPASPPIYQAHSIETLLVNTVGVYNILVLAKKKNARVLQASTSEIYGDALIHPQPENYWGNVNPNGVRSCYDEGKRAAESFVMNFRRDHGVDTRMIRIFNTYGPYMDADDGRVVSNFINQALNGKPITIYGDGSQTRSLCYVADLVDGIIRVMESSQTEPVNLGNPQELSVLTLAQEIIALTSSKSKIVFKPLPKDDPRQRCPDITRAKSLGWKPTIERKEGLKKTIEYYSKVAKK
jgi:UDP-glucuronate decarboxylase